MGQASVIRKMYKDKVISRNVLTELYLTVVKRLSSSHFSIAQPIKLAHNRKTSVLGYSKIFFYLY